MLPPRWHKVLADLWTNKVRTVLVVLSVAVGVFAVGMIATIYVILSHDMDVSYAEIRPAGGLMFTSGFSNDFLSSLGHLRGVGEVEGRAMLSAFKMRLGSNTDTRNLQLTVVQDYSKIRLDQIMLRSGNWPERREVAFERNSLSKLPVKVGDTIQVEMPDGKQRELRVSGIVEDRNADASNMSMLGYITLDTVEYLGYPRYFNYLLFTAAENAGDKEHVRQVGRTIEEQFTRNGGLVGATLVRDPGRHPAAMQAASILQLLAAMGVLTVLLSAFLVINTVSALMTQQVRSIGVMKAVGARTSQVLGMYVVLLLCFGLLALLLAAPAALLAGYGIAGLMARVLNFSLLGFRVEPLPFTLMVALSLLVPLLAGLVPVLGGARTTIRAAISGYGLGAAYGRSLVDRFFSHVRGLSRPLAISLRNTVRRKGRLVLTLATLVLGGAIFMGVMSTRDSMSTTVARLFHYMLADVNVDFDRPYRVSNMAGILGDVPGVTRVEGWIAANGEVLSDDRSSDNAAIDRIVLFAPPSDSLVVERQVQAGRWLLPDDQNAILMSTGIMSAHPEWHVGSTVRLKLNTKAEATFVIVGVFPFAAGEGNKISMASYNYLADLLNVRGQASSFRLVASPSDPATQDRVRDALAAQLKQMGYKVVVSSGHTNVDAVAVILNTILMCLLVMALLIALVGGLGLAGTMSMNVMERTREIGVMRSVGAGNGAIMRLVVVEGLLTGLLSWFGAALLSLPIGQLLSTILGVALFQMPFGFVFAPQGLLIWLIIVVVLAILASVLPAWNAARLTVREVLAYE